MQTKFLDCGAWTGCSVKLAKKLWPGCECFSFEPDPRNFHELSKQDTIIIKKAVWYKDSTTKLYLGLSQSNSLFREKRSGEVNPNNFITVETIDLSKWILDNLKINDYIVLKLNVEGAEYDILEKMHKDGILHWIDEFFIQWHWNKINVSKKRHDKISKSIVWKPWKSM